VVKTAMLLSVFLVFASALAGCHYSEDQRWQECCILVVHTDETSSSEGRIAILELSARTFFTGEGRGALSTDVFRRQKQKMERQLDSFLDGHPGARPSDYFAGLGMACRSLSNSKAGLAQCEADLRIWARCDKMRFMPFGHVPVPKELEQPIPAVLHVSVSLSDATVLDVSSRVFAIPGGRLCHR
jgi:hypothetical protein